MKVKHLIDADVATLQAETVLLRGQITAQQEQIASVNAYARECEALIREAESSIVWRVVRRLRRAAGIGPRP